MQNFESLVAELLRHSASPGLVSGAERKAHLGVVASGERLLTLLQRCGLITYGHRTDASGPELTALGRAVLVKVRSGGRLVWRHNCLELTRPPIRPTQQDSVVCRWWTGRPTLDASPRPLLTPSALLQTMRDKGLLQGRSSANRKQPRPAGRHMRSRHEAPRPALGSDRAPTSSTPRSRTRWLSRATRFEEPHAGGVYGLVRKKVGTRISGTDEDTQHGSESLC